MKNQALLFGSMLVMLFCQACEKISPSMWMQANETYCADPWSSYLDDSDNTESAIRAYYDEKKVKLLEVDIEVLSEASGCFACHCTTGRIVRCKIREKDQEILQQDGFLETLM